MSDWVLDEEPTITSAPINKSDWEAYPEEPSSQQYHSNEGLGMAALKAIPRIAEDVYQGGMGFLKNIPGYYQAAKTEVPGVFNELYHHPLRAAGQGLAGVTELGHNLLNTPRGIADYTSNRLNLLPQEYAQKIPMQRDISSDINQTFGEPEYAGEKLIRGLGRNSVNALGGLGVASKLNPLNLTEKSIAKNILNTEKGQVLLHNKLYDNLWDEAKQTGFNNVPVNEKLLSDNLSTIEKYKTPKEFESLESFILDPTLDKAQKAQSQMKTISRTLEEQSRKRALQPWELDVYNAANNAEKHIENNMFKDKSGNINEALQDKYRTITNSYRNNVVPYKYNQAIQKYKANEMLPSELINALSRGEFAAKKMNAHPALWLRNNLGKISTGLGLLGGGAWLSDHLFGNNQLKK